MAPKTGLKVYIKTNESINESFIRDSILDDIDKKKLVDADHDHYFQVDIELIDDYTACYKVTQLSIKEELLRCRGNRDMFDNVNFYFKVLSKKTKYNFIYDSSHRFYNNDAEFTTDHIVRKKYNPKLTNCGHCHAEIYKLAKCGDCRAVWYCNRECQLAHWGNHEHVCVPVAV